MKYISFFVHASLWLRVAASPTLAGLTIGFLTTKGDTSQFAFLLCGVLGFAVGSYWAESVRKSVGLSVFLGRTISMSEYPDGEARKQLNPSIQEWKEQTGI